MSEHDQEHVVLRVNYTRVLTVENTFYFLFTTNSLLKKYALYLVCFGYLSTYIHIGSIKLINTYMQDLTFESIQGKFICC
jgi:hypothetical protein